MQHDVWSVGFWMKRKKNTVRPIQKMTELNEVIEEGGLHSTGKCKSYGEDGGFIATKETRPGRSWNYSRILGEGGGSGVVVSFYLDRLVQGCRVICRGSTVEGTLL